MSRNAPSISIPLDGRSVRSHGLILPIAVALSLVIATSSWANEPPAPGAGASAAPTATELEARADSLAAEAERARDRALAASQRADILRLALAVAEHAEKAGAPLGRAAIGILPALASERLGAGTFEGCAESAMRSDVGYAEAMLMCRRLYAEGGE